MRIPMPYDCLKKPFDQLNADELDILSRYINSWYVDNCDSILKEPPFKGWLEERRDVDTVIRAFMKDYSMPDENLEPVKAMFLQMVDEKQFVRKIDKWYFDNAAIGHENMRFSFFNHKEAPVEAVDAMMNELGLKEDLREKAADLLWRCFREDFEMWC